MTESLKIPVYTEDNEKILEFELNTEEGIIQLKIDNKIICSGDWNNNFKNAFERMLEMWKF